ncbi:hypothetical protein RRG08_064419 [Elysia crispata]|uniref:Uncharacterized protein n=1 Tax=Elysia crispata TaxID=231223 RepID=A0AAE0ZZQ0_9GAST|nr:hypothetical protein RRG08_064419 [Elysia crispata]
MKLCGVKWLLSVLLPTSLAKIWEIPIPRSLQDCYNHVKHANTETFVGSTYSFLCEAGLKREQLGQPPKFDTQKSSYYQHLYDKAVQLGPPVRSDSPFGKRGRRMRLKRQAGALPRCVRKEYRMLSDDERTRFHAAINALKQDTVSLICKASYKLMSRVTDQTYLGEIQYKQ